MEGTDSSVQQGSGGRAAERRLVFQPLLVIWALWSTGAFSAWWNRSARR